MENQTLSAPLFAAAAPSPPAHHQHPEPLGFPLTDQTAIALSNPSGLWKHTPCYISFEEITGSLMKYADNKERKKGLRLG